MTSLRARALAALVSDGTVRMVRGLHRAVGRRSLELYHQVDDPYSHLLLQALPRLLEASGLGLDFILVPGPPPELEPEPELARAHAWRDAAWLAARHGLSLPSAGGALRPEAREEAEAILALPRPALEQLDVASRVGDALLSGAPLAALAARFGRAPSAAEPLARGAQLRARRGHYRGGMLRHEGIWYWGLDRLEELEEVLGLATSVLERRPLEALPPGFELEVDHDPCLEHFFSFRSPYAYLALERSARLAERHHLPLVIKAVLPMVMRGLRVPFVKRLYIVTDAARQARFHNIAFGAICDPLGAGVERCLAAFEHAETAGRGFELCASASRGIWSEGLDMTDDRDFERVVQRAGLDWGAVQAMADDGWRTRAEQNRAALLGLGLWGVPCFRFGSLAFWGQDRIRDLDEVMAFWRRGVTA